jgi:predicted metal-dependent peptidase
MRLKEFTKIVAILGKQHKIKVKESTRWAANIDNRTVFYRREDIHDLSEDFVLGLTLHEIAHIHYTQSTPPAKDNPELHHRVMNMMEDEAVENIISGDYPNAGKILGSTKEEVLDSVTEMLPKMDKYSIHERAILYASIRFEGRKIAAKEDYEILGEKIFEIIDPKREMILNRKRTSNLIPIADEIVKMMIKEAGIPDQNAIERMRNDHNNGDGNMIDEEQRDKINAIKSRSGFKDSGAGNYSRISLIEEITDQSTMIGKRLRSILKRNNASEFGGRFRTGKLIAKRFVKIRASHDRHPFARRIVKGNQSYAFSIAVDVSGSMIDESIKANPISCAMSSMYMMGEALRYAGVPRGMVIFGSIAKEIAKMGKGQVRWEEMTSLEHEGGTFNAGTNIGEAMERCIEQLENVRAERKIMIVLTDGDSSIKRVEEAYKRAQKKEIEQIAIIIGNQTDSYSITQNFKREEIMNIPDTREPLMIGDAFIDILKRSIKES